MNSSSFLVYSSIFLNIGDLFSSDFIKESYMISHPHDLRLFRFQSSMLSISEATASRLQQASDQSCADSTSLPAFIYIISNTYIHRRPHIYIYTHIIYIYIEATTIWYKVSQIVGLVQIGALMIKRNVRIRTVISPAQPLRLRELSSVRFVRVADYS